MSRSALYTEAVKTFVDHRKPGEITRQLNALYAKESSALDETLSNMQALSIPRETW